ncbi:MAG: SDR family NAD(P)-dependent oxidoreductase, partial [Pseudomonadota bacterium]
EDPDTVGRIQEEVTINAIAPLTVTKHALPQLLQSEEPTNLFVGSGVAFVPVVGTPVYSGTKSFLHQAAKALRHQLNPLGVSVFEGPPPVVATDMGNILASDTLKVMIPEDLVAQVWNELRKNRFEMVLGQSKMLRIMSRLAPEFIFREMAKVTCHAPAPHSFVGETDQADMQDEKR